MRRVACISLAGWAAIVALAWWLADRRIPARWIDVGYHERIAATSARDNILIVGLLVPFVLASWLAFRWASTPQSSSSLSRPRTFDPMQIARRLRSSTTHEAARQMVPEDKAIQLQDDTGKRQLVKQVVFLIVAAIAGAAAYAGYEHSPSVRAPAWDDLSTEPLKTGTSSIVDPFQPAPANDQVWPGTPVAQHDAYSGIATPVE